VLNAALTIRSQICNKLFNKGLFTAHELKWTKLQYWTRVFQFQWKCSQCMNWTDLQHVDPVTWHVHWSHALSVRIWLAAAKLGRLVLSQIVHSKHSYWNMHVQDWSSVHMLRTNFKEKAISMIMHFSKYEGKGKTWDHLVARCCCSTMDGICRHFCREAISRIEGFFSSMRSVIRST